MLVIDPEECIDCGACEPECPVEAIFPEDALPEKWEPFVRINAAFNEGMETVDGLADGVRHRAQRPERADRLDRGRGTVAADAAEDARPRRLLGRRPRPDRAIADEPPRHARDRPAGHVHAPRRRRTALQAHALRRRGAARARPVRARRACASTGCRGGAPPDARSTPGEGVPDRARRGADRGRLRPRPRRAPRRSTPRATAAEYERYGFRPAGPARVEVGGAFVEFAPARRQPTERPLLNHLAVLVDSADDAVADAEALGIEVESIVDAANTYAAFLRGPERRPHRVRRAQAEFSLA